MRVKIKSLAAESKMIRNEEKLADRESEDKDNRESLYLHRTIDVRKETRATLLLYSFLRGTPYSKVEPNKPTDLNALYAKTRAKKMGVKFGADIRDFDDWVNTT